VCSTCPVGRFGNATRLPNSNCSGPCQAGFACPVGSVSSNGTICMPGWYSITGGGVCVACGQGQYGSLAGLPSPNCSGLCIAGTYGSSPALNSPACSGNCLAGHWCPAGSTVATQNACPVGKFSLSGAAACSVCPGGSFGDKERATSSACTGPCAAGTQWQRSRMLRLRMA
jgi:hypothetical protein